MPKHGKKYTAAAAKVDSSKLYTPKEAVQLVKDIAFAGFDETVEVELGVRHEAAGTEDAAKATDLGHHRGRGDGGVEVDVAQATAAQEAGADIVGSDDLVAQVQAGNIDFDAAIATPPMMAKVGRLGRILGPRGLMPNPKLGTVTMDVAKMVNELKAGRVEYRADRYGICHVPVGRVSFPLDQIVENYGALLNEIIRVKPATAKGKYIKSVALASTMGPGVKVDSSIVRNLLEA